MPFETEEGYPIGASFLLNVRYTGSENPEMAGQLWFSQFKFTIGDLAPVADQEEAFQAFVDLVNDSDNFEVISANRVWETGQGVTPTTPSE
jgi:hypothetical protein